MRWPSVSSACWSVAPRKYEPFALADPAHTVPYTGPYATVWTGHDQARRAVKTHSVTISQRLERPDRVVLSARHRRGALVLATSAFVHVAGAAPTPFTPPTAGTVHEYSGRLFGVDCARWTLASVAADGSAVAECNGHRLALDGEGNPIAAVDPTGRKLVEFKPAAPGLRFPLDVGAHWRAPYTAYTAFNNLVWDGEASCRVEAFEPIDVPAGRFDAFRIECQDKWMVGPKNGYTHVTRWYAPAVATVVRQTHREDPARWSFELRHIGAPVAPAAAPTFKLEAVPTPGPRPHYDPQAPDILDPDEY